MQTKPEPFIKSMTLHDLPATERPRERLVSLGGQSLSLQDLLALVLGRGVAGEPVMTTAYKLLSRFGSLEGLSQASLEDLQSIKGIGLAKAAQIQACIELSRRLQRELHPSLSKSDVTHPEVVARLVRAKLTTYQKEHFALISLDARSRLLAVDVLSIGTLDAALVHPRETFEAALRRHAARVILTHNHPSGDPAPSDDDLTLTKRLVTAGKILGIAVVDHVIVTRDGWCSLQAQGLIS